MVKLYTAKLSDSGFLKLNYYIEEEISLDFLESLDKYTPIDGWVNGVLVEISRNAWSYEDPDIENLCNDIYSLLSKEENKPAPFFKAIDYIRKHNLIQWTEKI